MMDFSPENSENAVIERRECAYLYKASANYVLMDVADYSLFELTPAQVGSAAAFRRRGFKE